MGNHNLSMNKARLQWPSHSLLHFLSFASLSALLFSSQVKAQSWEFILTSTNLCAVDGQNTNMPISVSPGDEVIIQVKNNTAAQQLLRWRGVIYPREVGSTAERQEVAHSRRFYSLQKPVKAGETFIYHWKIKQGGTLTHHCSFVTEQII